jgi:hypothetical protein
MEETVPEAPTPERVRAHAAAERHPHIANLRAGSIFRGAVGLYRREPGRVATAALILLGPSVAVGIGSGAIVDRFADETVPERLLLIAVVAALAGVVGTFGTAAYAGVLDELVGSALRGVPSPSISAVARQLPIWSLVGADILVSIVVGVASFFGALPGLVLYGLMSIVGPIVNIERRRPPQAIARSIRLTTPRVVLTMVVVGIPLAVEIGAHHWLLHVRRLRGIGPEILVSVPLILTVGALVGLTEVVLAYALLARDPGSSVAELVVATLPEPGDGGVVTS